MKKTIFAIVLIIFLGGLLLSAGTASAQVKHKDLKNIQKTRIIKVLDLITDQKDHNTPLHKGHDHKGLKEMKGNIKQLDHNSSKGKDSHMNKKNVSKNTGQKGKITSKKNGKRSGTVSTGNMHKH
jgi:hypothetical protein